MKVKALVALGAVLAYYLIAGLAGVFLELSDSVITWLGRGGLLATIGAGFWLGLSASSDKNFVRSFQKGRQVEISEDFADELNQASFKEKRTVLGRKTGEETERGDLSTVLTTLWVMVKRVAKNHPLGFASGVLLLVLLAAAQVSGIAALVILTRVPLLMGVIAGAVFLLNFFTDSDR